MTEEQLEGEEEGMDGGGKRGTYVPGTAVVLVTKGLKSTLPPIPLPPRDQSFAKRSRLPILRALETCSW